MTGSAGGGLVASQHPVITNRKPTTVATVISSSRNNAPNAPATTGLTNVIRPAFAGPASAMSRKNTMKASAVQINARPSTASTTWVLGMVLGSAVAAIGV